MFLHIWDFQIYGYVTDTERCKDSEGNSASLNIIENTAVTGFPSVVVLGGNLTKDPDASTIASDGIENYAKGIVYGIDEYFKTDHSGLKSTEEGEVTYTDSVESRIINMQYVSSETMQSYIDNGDFENAIKSFTLDENRNVVIATWSQDESGSIELKTNNSMSLKTALEKYMMPFEYLLYFYIDTNYKDFVEDLADEVMNSEIVVAVQDSVTTTNTVETIEQRRDASVSEFDTDWEETSVTEYTTETASTQVDLTYVSTWCVKSYQENSYSEAVLELGDQQEKIVNVPGRVTETGPSTSISSESVVVDNAEGTYTYQDEDEDGNPVTRTGIYHYDILEHTITETHTISNGYEKGEYKTEGRENVFVELFNSHNMMSKIRTEDYLYQIIENNERTANLLDLTKYLIYKATNVPWGVLEFDFEGEYSLQSFTSTTGIYGGTIQEKVWFALRDLGYSEIVVAGAMGNIHHESGGFDPAIVESGSGQGIGLVQWSFGRRRQLESYAASKGVSWEDVDTQIEFLIAEISGQGPATGYASKRTRGAITEEGIVSTNDDWANSTTIEDATLHFMRFFESPLSKSSYSTRLEWAQKYYEEFKGREKPTGDDRIGQINLSGENATKMMQMLTHALEIADDDSHQYVWGAAHNGPDGWNGEEPQNFDCSSFVGYLYYKYFGIYIGGDTGAIHSNNQQYKVSMSELQPGDILWISGHVGMYIGNNQYVHASSEERGILVDPNPSYFTEAYRLIN